MTSLSGCTEPVSRTSPAVSVALTEGSVGGGNGSVGERQPAPKSSVPSNQPRRERGNIATEGSMRRARARAPTPIHQALELIGFIGSHSAADAAHVGTT